jgi:hypothetical protein
MKFGHLAHEIVCSLHVSPSRFPRWIILELWSCGMWHCVIMRHISAFWWNMLPSHNFKIEAAVYYKTLVPIYQSVQYYMPEDHCLNMHDQFQKFGSWLHLTCYETTSHSWNKHITCQKATGYKFMELLFVIWSVIQDWLVVVCIVFKRIKTEHSVSGLCFLHHRVEQ